LENFQFGMAIGFILAGIVIALFRDKRALFWGATLVVGAVTAFNPFWGLVTFVELVIGWFIGKWLLKFLGY
jgi:hypothetical protein